MREIIFRGKRKDNGEWVYGSLLKVKIGGNIAYLIFGEDFSFDGENVNALTHALVDPETVGQYTGLTTNGKKIFEGDVVLCKVIGIREEKIHKGFVEYTDDCFGVNIKGIVPTQSCLSFSMKNGDVEIIGNIHDNPELLKGGSE